MSIEKIIAITDYKKYVAKYKATQKSAKIMLEANNLSEG